MGDVWRFSGTTHYTGTNSDRQEFSSAPIQMFFSDHVRDHITFGQDGRIGLVPF